MLPPVGSPEIRFKLAVTLVQRWRGLLERLRGSQVRRGDHLMMTACFGRLTDKDEMVVRGLAAGLTSSAERGKGRP